jgi:hypothetical protein
LPKDLSNLAILLIIESRRSARAFQVHKSRKPLFFKSMDPVFNCPRGVSKQPPNLWATHAMGYEEHRMKSMVIPRIPRAANLVLEAKNHEIGFCYL